jgi:hypothetical protein
MCDLFGEPTYTFLKYLSTDNLIEDLTKLYIRLVYLGMEHRKGRVCLVDLNNCSKGAP